MTDVGFFLLARKLIGPESWLMSKPPLWMKLWIWMLGKANFVDRDRLRRGQFVTSTSEMRRAMSYHIGYRLHTPTKDEVRSAYEAFAKATMITTVKTTRGMIVTICNYDKYQNFKSYETHNEDHNENVTKTTVAPHVTKHIEGNKNKAPLSSTNEKYTEAFELFWAAYPRKVGKGEAARVFAKQKLGNGKLQSVLDGVERWKASKRWEDGYIKDPAAWLKQCCFDDSPEPAKTANQGLVL